MGEFEPKFQKINKRSRDIPSSSEKEGVDKENYTAQTLPLKTKAVRYSGRTVVHDVFKYDHVVHDTRDGIDQEEIEESSG